MKKLNLAAVVYNGFIWACLITLLCVRSVVICMKINIGVLFLVSFISCSIVLGVLCFVRKKNIGAIGSLINLCVCGLALFLVYQFIYRQELLLKPAFVVRMAFHRQIVSAEWVNGILMAVIILGYLCVFAVERYMQTKKEKNIK